MTSTTIVGGGIAGFTVANELRKSGYDGEITIIDPNGVPYDRPPLSKEFLVGTKSAEDLQFRPASWLEENKIGLLQRNVERIDADAQKLVLDGGEEFPYDNLVIATGGLARRGRGPGFDNENISILRTTEDAEALRAKITPGTTLGIIGAGLVGAEVASSARELGANVVLIDPAPVSLIPAVGEELATRLHEMHEANGVAFINAMTSSIEEADGKFTIGLDGDLDGDESVTVDAVLLCIGIIPETLLAESAGLEVDNGVLVDEQQRTADPHIWAVGDCARTRLEDGMLLRRHEHWDSAIQEAQAAAASIAGKDAPTHSASWFWSDRYGCHVEGTGDMTLPGETIIREDAEGRPSVALRVNEDGDLVGAAAIDDSMAVRAARRIIDRGIKVDREKLADTSIPLKKLAR